MLGLVAVEAAETLSGNLGWISADEDSTWYNALYCVALSLIHQYTIMSVNEKEVKIFTVALNNLLHAVLIFFDRFSGLIVELKSQLVIADISLDLTQVHLQVYKYDLDPGVEPRPPWSTTSSCVGTPPLALELTLNL